MVFSASCFVVFRCQLVVVVFKVVPLLPSEDEPAGLLRRTAVFRIEDMSFVQGSRSQVPVSGPEAGRGPR